MTEIRIMSTEDKKDKICILRTCVPVINFYRKSARKGGYWLGIKVGDLSIFHALQFWNLTTNN